MRILIKNALITGVMVAAIIATGSFESVWAVPLAPKFDPPVKVFSGRSDAPGAKILATDGVQFYSAYIAAEGGDEANTLKLARGSSSGKNWDIASTIAKRGPRVLDGQVSVAVSGDVASPSRSIVHVVWKQGDDAQSGTEAGLYYSWASDADLNTWSAPARINGPVADVRSISIVAGKAGELYVVFMGKDRKMYYCSAASHKATFAKPALIPGTPMEDDRAVDVALDNSNNLHIGFATADKPGKIGAKYTQKSAKNGNWTPPVDVVPATAVENHGFIAIAASDANNVHIASTILDEAALDVYSSINGGRLWSKKTVTTDKTSTHVSIAASPDKALTVGVAFTDTKTGAENARIFRSTDGITWSGAAIIPNETSVNIVADATGKVGVLTHSANLLHSFSKER